MKGTVLACWGNVGTVNGWSPGGCADTRVAWWHFRLRFLATCAGVATKKECNIAGVRADSLQGEVAGAPDVIGFSKVGKDFSNLGKT